MRSYVVIATAVVLTIASAVTLRFFPGVAAAMHQEQPAVSGAPAEMKSCPNSATVWCRDLGGLPE